MQEIILLPKIIQVVNLFCIFRCLHVFSEFSSPTKTSGYGLNSNYSTKSFDSSNASSLLYFSTSAPPRKKHQERPHLLLSSSCSTLYLFIGQPIFFAVVINCSSEFFLINFFTPLQCAIWNNISNKNDMNVIKSKWQNLEEGAYKNSIFPILR